MQVSAAGGEPQELTTLEDGEISHRWPEFLPDGKAVLFTALTANTLEAAQTVVRSLETGERRALIPGASYARYVPTGHLVYIQSATPGTLLAAPFDLSRLEVTGAPFPVVEGVMMSPNGSAQFSFSHLGALVYVPGGAVQAAASTLVWVDRQGAVEQLGAPSQQYSDPRLSPDGRRLAVRIVGASADIWVYDIPRGTLTRLTFEGSNQHPQWTPDGRRVAFRSNRAGPINLFWKPADGSGAAERLTTSENATQSPSSWSSDGQVLAFFQRSVGEDDSNTLRDIWVLPIEGERKPRPFLQTPFEEAGAVFSPDGNWLAYMSTESGRQEIYMQPFPGPGGKSQISTEGGREPIWARNGREIFYRNGNQMMAVEITTEPTFSAGTPKMLFEGGNFQAAVMSRAHYDVTPDGQRFVMIQLGGSDSAPAQINVVLNWFEELKRRVPTGQ